MARRALLLSLTLTLLGCPPPAQVPDEEVGEITAPPLTLDPGPEGSAPEAGRLPDDVVPTHYRLGLRVDPSAEQGFEGEVAIRVRLESPRRKIYLHARRLEVSEARALPRNGQPLEAEFEPQADDDHFAVLTLPRALEGEVTLVLHFRAPWGEALGGLYRVAQGEDHYAFTQMEPLDARTAFPCFDEPRFKTPFEVSVEAPADLVVVGNAPEERRGEGRPGEGSGEDEGRAFALHAFAETPPIPTYLFALAVGPLELVEATVPPNEARETPLPFRGFAPRGQGAELAYAMQHTPAILEALEEWFGIPYPYAKLDVVAVPDFGAGAMENVGLVTFRANLLLVDEERTPTRRLRFFAYLMAHELAHMWFGNLVTMQWWDDLWLNEAFASWMEHRAVEVWRPGYEPDVELLDWVSGVFPEDGLEAARAIRQPIVTSHDIHNAFDGITYAKGAGVLQMFESWLGRDVFQRGIRAYLAEHRFGNATADDLMRALGQAANRDVATPMNTFVTQPGIPFLEANTICEGQDPRMEITQRRYLPAGSRASTDARWQVPVCLRVGRRGQEPMLACEQMLDSERATFPLPGEGCPSWVHPNANGHGYYRWALPASQMRALVRAGDTLSTTERMSLLDSYQAAFDNGSLEGGAAIEGLLAFADDEHHAVATAPIAFLRSVLDDVVADGDRRALRRTIQRAYQRNYGRLGWAPRSGESEENKLRRAEVVRLFARDLEERRARAEAARRGRAYLTRRDDALSPEAVSPDLLDTALWVTIQDGDAELWDTARSRFSAESDGTVRRALLVALAATRDPAKLDDALALSLADDVRANERLRPVGTLLARGETRERAWAWLQANFDALVERLPPSYAGYLPLLAAGGCEPAFAEQVQAFFAEKVEALPGGPRNLAAATESIRLCAARREAQRPHVHEWLD